MSYLSGVKEEVDKFVVYLEKERRYSSHTAQGYRTDLLQFASFLESECGVSEWSEVSSLHVRSWMVYLSELKRSSKTINRKLSSVRSFFQFMMRNSDVKINPASLLKGPKNAKRLPQFLQKEEIQQLLGPEPYSDEWIGLRDRLIINMLYTCGLRRSELIGIKEADVDVQKRWIKVLGKGQKERLVPLSGHVLELYHEYCKAKGQEGFSNDTLFVAKSGEPLYPKAVYNIVVQYLSRVTSLEYKGPHVLRHTFATHLTNGGAEIRAIQELLGHASLAATQVYTHNSIDKLKRAYRKAHPKA